jgi:hypothetical protein
VKKVGSLTLATKDMEKSTGLRRLAVEWGRWDFVEIWFDDKEIRKCEMWGTEDGFPNFLESDACDFNEFLSLNRFGGNSAESQAKLKDEVIRAGVRLAVYNRVRPIDAKGLGVLKEVMNKVCLGNV